MCRYDTNTFDPEVSETRAARRWIVDVLRRWELAALCDELELAGSELVTNALLHTRSGFDVVLATCDGMVELAVRDRDPREPVLRPARLDLLADVDSLHPTDRAALPAEAEQAGAEPGAPERHPSMHVGPAGSIAAGRGLIIVDAIADEWGVSSHSNGKDVWLRLPVPGDWPYLRDCDCSDHHEHTPSGRPVVHTAGDWDRTASTGNGGRSSPAAHPAG